MTEQEIYDIKKQICEIGENLWLRGMVASNDGNISVRIGEGLFVTTPSGVSKKYMTPEMMITMNAENKVVGEPNGFKPSSEFKLHLKCYELRPEVNAVVHAHPPIATGYAVSRVPLDGYNMSEAVMLLGSVPVAEYATPGSDEVADSIAEFLPYHDAILLANHGAVTMGKNLMTAYFRMESVEQVAKTTLVSRLLGGAQELPKDKIDELCDIGKNYALRHPGYRKYS
ncbi:MAG: class II aldolase/adducin family protein [Ruminiclostridium sp.]|nr:class II aldolase/adducin family protein [Ruminiclostridium sp.]